MRIFRAATAMIGFAAAATMATSALAAQDTPTSINGIETVCTGVG